MRTLRPLRGLRHWDAGCSLLFLFLPFESHLKVLSLSRYSKMIRVHLPDLQVALPDLRRTPHAFSAYLLSMCSLAVRNQLVSSFWLAGFGEFTLARSVCSWKRLVKPLGCFDPRSSPRESKRISSDSLWTSTLNVPKTPNALKLVATLKVSIWDHTECSPSRFALNVLLLRL